MVRSFFRYWAVALSAAVMLSDCASRTPQPEPAPLCRVVTDISVMAVTEEAITSFHYTSPDKMEAVLNYLRLTHPRQSQDIAPETFRANIYTVTLSLSDGHTVTYRQISESYLQRDFGPWQPIRPSGGWSMEAILAHFPSDG